MLFVSAVDFLRDKVFRACRASRPRPSRRCTERANRGFHSPEEILLLNGTQLQPCNRTVGFRRIKLVVRIRFLGGKTVATGRPTYREQRNDHLAQGKIGREITSLTFAYFVEDRQFALTPIGTIVSTATIIRNI